MTGPGRSPHESAGGDCADDRARTFSDIKDLADPAFKRIALGDPAAVRPECTRERTLEKEGLWFALQSRDIVPTSACAGRWPPSKRERRTPLSWYRTDALIARRAKIAWLVPLERGPRIVYPAAMIRRGGDTTEVQRFVTFLRGEAGRECSPGSNSHPRERAGDRWTYSGTHVVHHGRRRRATGLMLPPGCC